MLHDCDSLGDGEDSLHEPPHVANVTERERDREPPSHVAEHELHDPHVPNTQLVGQQPVLHDCESLVDGDVSPQAPPHDASDTERVRVCVPLPHVAEHEPHILHEPNTQSTGQQPVLHC